MPSYGKKIRVRKNDRFRILLTETLPYELPLAFSNEGLYRILTKKSLEKGALEKIDDLYDLRIFKNKKWTIPYKYKIKKNTYEFRELSIMHPASQINACSLYNDYEHLILSLCQRSKFSLRAPAGIAKYYTEKYRSGLNSKPILHSAVVEEISDDVNRVSPVATSYFAYKRYSMLYKFYESAEYVDLEKRFKFLTKLDISSCFDRIYTHTLAWAVKSKAHAKNVPRDVKTFESEFDKFMRDLNHGETAGIVIGPEISRIFAEIILQKIDLNVLAAAKLLGLIEGEDYTLRRYVDDYFLYSNSEDCQDKIRIILADCLSPYRLSLNVAKTQVFVRPFITGASVIRHDISDAISKFFDRYREIRYEDADGEKKKKVCVLKKADHAGAVSSQAIFAIKRSIGEGGSYDESSNYFFGTFRRLMSRLAGSEFSAVNGDARQNLFNFLSSSVDVLFFFYSMTPRMRQTYLLSEILLLIVQFAESTAADFKDSLIRKITHEARAVMKSKGGADEPYSVEKMNLLLVLKTFGVKYLFDESFVHQIFGVKIQDDGSFDQCYESDYFKLMFLLAYVGGEPKYENLQNFTISQALGQFANKDWCNSAEAAMLFLDLCACPFIGGAEKLSFVSSALAQSSSKPLTQNDIAEIVKLFSSQDWFFNWKWSSNLPTVLKKKELRSPYL